MKFHHQYWASLISLFYLFCLLRPNKLVVKEFHAAAYACIHSWDLTAVKFLSSFTFLCDRGQFSQEWLYKRTDSKTAQSIGRSYLSLIFYFFSGQWLSKSLNATAAIFLSFVWTGPCTACRFTVSFGQSSPNKCNERYYGGSGTLVHKLGPGP